MIHTEQLRTKKLIAMVNKAQDLLDRFVDSVGELLNDINALEVNTMIVEKITGAKFNALEAYQLIYSINDEDYFKNIRIPQDSALRERYKQLFKKLEREYFYLLTNPESKLSEADYAKEKRQKYQERIRYLKENTGGIVESSPEYIRLMRPILPNPTELGLSVPQNLTESGQSVWQNNWLELQALLNNNQFLRSLRKIIELKAALDSTDPTKNETDIIYAQTVMQLDGDIITRYNKKLFDNEELKDLVLKTHNEGVFSGEKQWRSLLEFMVNLLKSVTKRRLI